MCELIRAAFHFKLFGDYGTLDKPDKNFLGKIDCPGKGDVTQPCAYTDKGFWDHQAWTFAFKPVGLRLKDLPNFVDIRSIKGQTGDVKKINDITRLKLRN